LPRRSQLFFGEPLALAMTSSSRQSHRNTPSISAKSGTRGRVRGAI
jgi:hypothetical protein